MTMPGERGALEIKRVRNEVLVALKVVYPGALQAEQVMRSLLSLFPTLEFEYFRRDLAYLTEKGYIERVITDAERDGALTPWRHRWFRLTARGVEVADHCVRDPALEES
jgi:hypothetical protein